MANKKIPALTAATTPLAGTEVAPIVQSGTTVKAAVTSFTNALPLTPASVTLTTGNMVLNGGITSDVALIKNTGQSFGVATDRWIGSDGTTSTWFYNVPTGGNHYFAINNVNKLTVVGDNVNIPVGNIVPGTAAKGINFTANTPAAGMTSQLLNWYEEGTFDPRLSFATGGDTCSYSGRTGRYTRIGRLVTVNIYIGLTAKGAGTGNVSLINLPFTAGSYSSAVPRVVSMTSTGTVSAYIYSGQSVFTFFSVDTAGAETQITNTNITNSTEIVLTLAYIV